MQAKIEKARSLKLAQLSGQCHGSLHLPAVAKPDQQQVGREKTPLRSFVRQSFRFLVHHQQQHSKSNGLFIKGYELILSFTIVVLLLAQLREGA